MLMLLTLLLMLLVWALPLPVTMALVSSSLPSSHPPPSYLSYHRLRLRLRNHHGTALHHHQQLFNRYCQVLRLPLIEFSSFEGLRKTFALRKELWTKVDEWQTLQQVGWSVGRLVRSVGRVVCLVVVWVEVGQSLCLAHYASVSALAVSVSLAPSHLPLCSRPPSLAALERTPIATTMHTRARATHFSFPTCRRFFNVPSIFYFCARPP